jgi:multiple sugar transport system substrate-binding protein
MKKIQKIIALCVVLVSSVVLSGCGLKDNSVKYNVTLEVWGVFDSADAYGSIFADYRKLNPYVTAIKYKKLNVDTYKQDLVDALAAGNGPDIFLVRNTWVPAFQDKIVAAPDTSFSDELGFRNAFVDVAVNDFMGSDKKIYGAPLSVDSLALYYNKDLFNAAGILTPPATWEEFARDAAMLTKIDSYGNIIQSGAALGTAYNINRSTDVLMAMMLQSGVPFQGNVNTGIDFQKGASALDFYTKFANTQSPTYSWNALQHYSIDSFYEGQAAMMINFSYHYDTLIHKNAKLNIATAQLPQFENGVKADYANYWGYVVAKNKDFGPEVKDKTAQDKVRVYEAWQFLKYMTMPNGKTITLHNALTPTSSKDFTMPNDPAQMYLTLTKKPAARRDLLEQERRDVVLGPFAEGNIIARNWVQVDPETVETIFAETIDSINRGAATVDRALIVAQNRVGYLMH